MDHIRRPGIGRGLNQKHGHTQTPSTHDNRRGEQGTKIECSKKSGYSGSKRKGSAEAQGLVEKISENIWFKKERFAGDGAEGKGWVVPTSRRGVTGVGGGALRHGLRGQDDGRAAAGRYGGGGSGYHPHLQYWGGGQDQSSSNAWE